MRKTPGQRLCKALPACLFLGGMTGCGLATCEPAALNWSADDSARIAFLHDHGVRVDRPNVVVWAPEDSLEVAALEALADSLDRGVAGIRDYMGGPYPWQRIGSRPHHVLPGSGSVLSLTPLQLVRCSYRFPGSSTHRRRTYMRPLTCC